MAGAGIHLPVLPTVVLGGLPAGGDWVSRQLRLGVDVVSSGADPDTDQTLQAVRDAAPFRPIKATGPAARLVSGAWLVEAEQHGDGAFSIEAEDTIVVQDGLQYGDQNDVAAALLDRVGDNPARWWVAARGLETASEADAEWALTVMVEGTKLVRLYLSKQQF